MKKIARLSYGIIDIFDYMACDAPERFSVRTEEDIKKVLVEQNAKLKLFVELCPKCGKYSANQTHCLVCNAETVRV